VLDGAEHPFVYGSPSPVAGTRELWLGSDGWSCRLEILDRETRIQRILAGIQREEGAADPEVRSPMPGTVVSVSVHNGDQVEAGQVLLSVEAMKMEHQLVASVSGTVHLSSKTGDLVKADQVLATIHVLAEPTSEAAAEPDPELTAENQKDEEV
jgi:acetyl-CoA/propionyl-CoA carboxylase, biotin carboxylase, biotin carboxyl carrier protein